MIRALWLALSAHLIGFSLSTHAAEAPGALTIVVRDQNTERPLSSVQVTITERETALARSLETDAQGRIVVDQLDPGLYSVTVTKVGFAPVYEPSVRVITRKNSRIELELCTPTLERVVVQARALDAFASPSSTYLDREALQSAVGGGADPLLSLDGLPGLASTCPLSSRSGHAAAGPGLKERVVDCDPNESREVRATCI